MIAGRYSLIEEIGRGGMGVVWRGHDRVLERPVALKRVGLLPGATGPDLARAEREARLAARLDHEHVVAVFDLVVEESERWLVMEYVEGKNLGQLVQRAPLLPDTAARLLGQAADALSAAHRAGIVHRDVKPSNILVTPDGRVKLTDFGIARALADPTLTASGLMTGSPAYLSPEVAAGGHATAASDVWGLGATLFHALAGAPPYDTQGNLMGALYKIVHEEPPRLQDTGWLQPALEHTLARDPARRWSMEEVRDFLVSGGQLPGAEERTAELEGPDSSPTALISAPANERPVLVTAGPSRSEAPPRRRRGALLAGLFALAAVAVVAALSWLLLFHEPARTDADQAGRDPGPAKTSRPRVTRSPGTTPATPSRTPTESPTETPTQTPTPTQTQTPTPTRTSDPAPDPPSNPGGSGAQMAAFVQDYFSTVTADPASTWQRLTPQFQSAAGGYDSYVSFWSTIASATASGIEVDPGQGVVRCTVVYQKQDGSSSTEQKTYQLVEAEDGYLIAGET